MWRDHTPGCSISATCSPVLPQTFIPTITRWTSFMVFLCLWQGFLAIYFKCPEPHYLWRAIGVYGDRFTHRAPRKYFALREKESTSCHYYLTSYTSLLYWYPSISAVWKIYGATPLPRCAPAGLVGLCRQSKKQLMTKTLFFLFNVSFISNCIWFKLSNSLNCFHTLTIGSGGLDLRWEEC